MKAPSAGPAASALGLCLLAALQGVLADSAPRLRAQHVRIHAPAPVGKLVDLLEVFRGDNASEAVGSVGGPVVLAASKDEPATPDFDLKAIEGRLAEMKSAGGLKATPGMMKFVKMTKGLIKDTVKPKILKAHADAQKLVDSYKEGFTRCFSGPKTYSSLMAALKTQRGRTSQTHRNCRRLEAKVFKTKKDCDKLLAAREDAMKSSKKALAVLMRDPDTEADKAHASKKEKYVHWLDRNEEWFKKRKIMVKIAKRKYAKAKREYASLKPKCKKKSMRWVAQRALCNVKQDAYEETACSLGKKMTEHCENYHTCFADTKDTYEKEKPDIMKQEKDRLAEWSVLMRVDCLLDVFAEGDGQVSSAQMAKCDGEKHRTDHLVITYPEVPSREKCPRMPEIPGQKKFRSVSYGTLPKGSGAKVMSLCVLKAGAGIALRAPKGASQTRCYSVGSYLKASRGGSCLFSKQSRMPMKVDYTKDRFTKYTFTMKMTGDPKDRNGSPMGGFSPCNVDGIAIKRGSSPELSFHDALEGAWGFAFKNSDGLFSRYGKMWDAKKAFAAAVPRCHGRMRWEVVMRWNSKKRKLYLYSWKVNGVQLSKYNDLPTNCWARDDKDFGFTPRVFADSTTSAVSVKDFRVYQGVVPFNMPQIVGLGIPKTRLQVTCAKKGVQYVGKGVPGYGKVKARSVNNCQKRCSYLSGCRFFTYNAGWCQYFSTARAKKSHSKFVVSGPETCEKGASGLAAEFWTSSSPFKAMPDPELQLPEISRTDSVVWYHTTKALWPGLSKRYFAGRWTGSLIIQTAGEYSMELESDNPSDLLIDGKPLLKNQATKPVMKSVAKTIELSKGFHKIEVTMLRQRRGAGLKLRYKGPDTLLHRWLVPTEALRPRAP